MFKYRYGGWEYWDSDHWNDEFPRSSTAHLYFEACVPENFDGLVILLMNTRLTGELEDHFFNLNNLDTVEAFRLPAAVPNQ